MKIDTAKYGPGMTRSLAGFRRAIARGMPRVGWKVGLNVPEVLAHFDVSHAAVGWLAGHAVMATGSVFTPPDGAVPRVEAEVCIRVARTVSAGCSDADALAAIAGVAPALEIVNYAVPPGDLTELVAGSMLHCATVVGAEQPLASLQSLGGRWPVLRVGDADRAPDRSDLVPDSLGAVVAFAADFLGAFGETLEAGDRLMSGSYFAQAAPLEAGTRVVADYGPFGAVSVVTAAA